MFLPSGLIAVAETWTRKLAALTVARNTAARVVDDLDVSLNVSLSNIF